MVIKLNIDLAKIDKTKIKEFTRKDGTKGAGLDLVVFLKDEADAYGNNGFVSISVPKDSPEKGAILGNAKIAGQQQATPQPTPAPQQATVSSPVNDLPF